MFHMKHLRFFMALMGLFGRKHSITAPKRHCLIKYLIDATEFGLHKHFNSKKDVL